MPAYWCGVAEGQRHTAVHVCLQAVSCLRYVGTSMTGKCASQPHPTCSSLVFSSAAGAVTEVACTPFAVTPLTIAGMMGHTQIVRMLLEAGADPNAKTINGGTAIRHARNSGQTECERLLREAGALESDDEDDSS